MRRLMFFVILFGIIAIQSGRADNKLQPQMPDEHVEVNDQTVVGIWQQIRFQNDEVVLLPQFKIYSPDHTFNLVLVQKMNASGITTSGTWSAEPGYITETLDADCNNLFAGEVMKLPTDLYNKDVMTISYKHPLSKQNIMEFWVRVPKFEKSE